MDLEILIGIGSLALGYMARDRQILNKITDGDSNVHKRIDQMIKTFNDDYVKKEDLKVYFINIQSSVDRLTERVEKIIDRMFRKNE